MRFILTIEKLDPKALRPGVPLAQTLREVARAVEIMNPLGPGAVNDRLSGEKKATWQAGTPLQTDPIITTFGPNPGPLGEGTFGFSLTGNFFPEGAWVYFDGEPVPITDVYSQWSITGTANKKKEPTDAYFVLRCGGLDYCAMTWPFKDPLPAPTLTSIDPATVPTAPNATTPMTLKLYGTNFTVDSVGIINGVAAATQFFSAGEIRASFNTPTVAGNLPVLVRTPDCPDTASINLVVTAAEEVSHTR